MIDLAEVRVSRTILRQARQRFLVCDHTKLGRSAPALLGSLSELDAVFIDPPLRRVGHGGACGGAGELN